jgi:hypothetical protein
MISKLKPIIYINVMMISLIHWFDNLFNLMLEIAESYKKEIIIGFQIVYSMIDPTIIHYFE